MAKRASKARRKDPQPATPVLQVVESLPAEPEAERPSQAPIMTPPTAEALAAHDSFVRSPAAVVESLGIRVTPAVARRLASIPPPVPVTPQEA